MLDSTTCPRCSSNVLPGEASCASCGAPLSSATKREARPGVSGAHEGAAKKPKSKGSKAGAAHAEKATPARASTEAADQRAAAPAAPLAGPRGATISDPRLAVLGLGVDGPASSARSGELQPHDPTAPPVHMPANWHLDLRSMAERPEAPQLPEPEPDDAMGHIPGGYLAPSVTYRGSGWAPPGRGQAGPSEQSAGPSTGVSVGAVPITSLDADLPLEAAPQELGPAPAMIAPPAPAIVTTSALRPSAASSVRERPATSTAAQPARKESAQELVAFGLVAAGGVVGFASFFLPWAGPTGIGIGTVASASSPPQSNQWAWGMPAAIPLLLLTGFILGAAAGSDRAQQRLPDLAPVIGRVTDTILPMLLGGIYFGVGLLYVTLPPQFGFGSGIFVLLVAACLLLAGSIVALFFPPGDNTVAG